MSQLRQVMYIGKRSPRMDNVCQGSTRSWKGLGDIIPCHQLDAVKLCKYSDSWVDVTDMDEEHINEVVSSFRDQYDRQRAAQVERNLGVKTLETATIEELEARMEALQSRAPVVKPDTGKSVKVSEGELNAEEKEATIDTLVEAIGVLDTADADHFDEDGRPQCRILAQLTSLLEVTEEQRDQAWRRYSEQQLD